MTTPARRTPARIAVVYYSAPWQRVRSRRGGGRASVGAELRLRHVAELNQELLISAKQYWGRHRSEIGDEPDARLEDIEWADGIAFGTPTRFGNVSAQLTVGHSIHEPPAFLDLLRGAGVEGIPDVRRFPGSRRNPQFSSDELAATLAGPTGRSSHRPDKSFEVVFTTIARWRDGKLVEEYLEYDNGSFMQQLGLP